MDERIKAKLFEGKIISLIISNRLTQFRLSSGFFNYFAIKSFCLQKGLAVLLVSPRQ